jgi:glutathione synthase/RimK-type ligase-like ATP-grasp enzyme
MQNNIRCLIQACTQNDIAFRVLDDNGHVVQVDIGTGLIFRHNVTPFNTESVAKICLDKSQTYALLHQHVHMPKTLSFLDINVQPEYQDYLQDTSLADIISRIEKTLSYPVVIKMNRGSIGKQVYLCHDSTAIMTSLQTIFDKTVDPYDYLALAQERISLGQEFRAVFFRQQLLLCYERAANTTNFGARHWEQHSAYARKVTETNLLKEIAQCMQPVWETLGINYVGVDLIKDNNDRWYLLEMNSGPTYDHYIQFYGQDDIVALYAHILCTERARYR